ncbi:MAG: patatin-like phospholipase family protein [Terracidiphilus sp.]|jgi:hypothetical protein
MAKFRILSLDGGGSWALIQVMALIDLYGGDATGHEVLREFDLAAANSGGSIVLGGLVENMPLGTLLNFFLSEAKRRTVFYEEFNLVYAAERVFAGVGPKYSTEEKLKGLEAALPKRGKKSLPLAVADIVSSQSGKPVHLLITGFDYDRNRARFFRSASASGPDWGQGDPAQVLLAESIHASTNAPVNYFDKPAVLASDAGKRYWDGAISGSNNPVLAAVSEAIVLNHPPAEIAALSIGTGTLYRPLAAPNQQASVLFEPYAKQGFKTDLRKLATAILDDPPDAANFLAHVMMGGPLRVPRTPADSRIARMSPMISPIRDDNGIWQLPDGLDENEFQYLAGLAMDAVEQDQVLAIQNFASLWLQDKIRNQPIRMDENLNRELGQDWYSQAKAAWQAIR